MLARRWAAGQLWVVNAFAVLAGLVIIVGIVLVVVDVVMRAAGLRPPHFTVAFVEYILLYFALLSAPYLVRHKGHVLTDMLVQRLPTGLRRVLEKLVYLLCIAIALVFMKVGASLFIEAIELGYMDERSVDIPYGFLYALFPPCFLLIALEFGRYLLGADSLYERELQLDSA
ncbi:MAG: TRAP transporter small permease [Burkholderiaceae bacterium]